MLKTVLLLCLSIFCLWVRVRQCQDKLSPPMPGQWAEVRWIASFFCTTNECMHNLLFSCFSVFLILCCRSSMSSSVRWHSCDTCFNTEPVVKQMWNGQVEDLYFSSISPSVSKWRFVGQFSPSHPFPHLSHNGDLMFSFPSPSQPFPHLPQPSVSVFPPHVFNIEWGLPLHSQVFAVFPPCYDNSSKPANKQINKQASKQAEIVNTILG